MAENFIQLPADSTGKKTRTKSKTIGSNAVHISYVAQDADPTYYIWVTPMALAQNKLFLSFLNNSGSGQVLKLRKLFFINAALAAVTGVGVQFDIKRISAITGGTGVTPNPADTGDGSLTNITCVHTATSATEGIILYSWYTNNDEIGLTGGFPQATIQSLISTQPEGNEIKELNLLEGEGFCVKQITNSTVGTFGVLAVITKELTT